MSVVGIALAGFLATVVMTTLMTGSQKLGLTRVSFPYLLGTTLTPSRDRALIIGYALHMLNGWVIATVYVAFFEYLDMASWWFGGLLGLIHGVALFTTLMPLLPGLHPRMASEHQGPEPTRALEPPGILALNYGKRTPLVGIVAHAAYGAILGAVYQLVGS